MTELEKYAALVEESIITESILPIPNTGLEKAQVIIEKVVKHSTEKIIIFCKELSGDVYASPQIRELIKQALLRSVEFEIFIQKEHPAATSKPLMDLFQKFAKPSQVIIKTLFDNEKFSTTTQNFCIADGKMVRIETERTNREGKFFANNKWLVERLAKPLHKMRTEAHALLA